MSRRSNSWILTVAAYALIWSGVQAQATEPDLQSRIAREVPHELTLLPYYKVFDYLNYSVKGSTVTLQGQVTSSALKTAAGSAVGKIEGVRNVDNRIEVLPPSSADDRLRLAVYAATYGQLLFNQYAVRAVAPVHIIVKNGNVTLEGTVDTQTDKTQFFTQASGVQGVVSVTDHLKTVG